MRRKGASGGGGFPLAAARVPFGAPAGYGRLFLGDITMTSAQTSFLRP
jgi:hypothetical protein